MMGSPFCYDVLFDDVPGEFVYHDCMWSGSCCTMQVVPPNNTGGSSTATSANNTAANSPNHHQQHHTNNCSNNILTSSHNHNHNCSDLASRLAAVDPSPASVSSSATSPAAAAIAATATATPANMQQATTTNHINNLTHHSHHHHHNPHHSHDDCLWSGSCFTQMQLIPPTATLTTSNHLANNCLANSMSINGNECPSHCDVDGPWTASRLSDSTSATTNTPTTTPISPTTHDHHTHHISRTASSSPSTVSPKPVRRREHNDSERKRRDHLRNAFNSLRDQVPRFKSMNKKPPRIQILHEATSYVLKVIKEAQELERRLADEKQRHEKLNKRIEGISFTSTNVN